MKKAYDSLAEWFEYLNDDCDYLQWSQYFIQRLDSLHVGKNGLELGCGSGAFCRLLTKAGYFMIGGDISLPMLEKACGLAQNEGLRIPYFLIDAENPKTTERLDFILAPNDCYNYIMPEKLPLAFKRAAKCLKKEGIFWFDLSSEYKLREKVANNIFADDREEVTYLSFNRLNGDSVEMDVTLFVKRGDGSFSRFDEKHTQYIHSDGAVRSALLSAGFEIVAVEGHLGEGCEKSDRLNYICRRK